MTELDQDRRFHIHQARIIGHAFAAKLQQREQVAAPAEAHGFVQHKRDGVRTGIRTGFFQFLNAVIVTVKVKQCPGADIMKGWEILTLFRGRSGEEKGL
ncbi:hypothetical protein AA103587_1326 [Gluconobacter kanchanaburiensis NBRC 103587]|nr:hypothetical protein AA103587_1326 [Gluconobacter kanchanaburiensis NBRC 103587]